MIEFSAKNRTRMLGAMAEEELDLLIIGGGITGAGIAWDASLRGMKTGLLEMRDFSWGTSSRSTKLIHGGLRYLKNGEVKLVMEVGRERALLHKHAPHIVIPAPMLLPIYKGGSLGYLESAIGLYIYDLLAGVKRSERRQMMNKEKTSALEPLLRKEDLKGSGYYYEYRTDDARLTIEILKTAHANGALIANYVSASDFLYHRDGQVAGVKAIDHLTGETVDIYAKKIVNATGPWVDQTRKQDNSLQGKRLLLTKGVHLVVDEQKLPVQQAVYFDVPDGRMIFVIPRGNKTYIGTTDTVYAGAIEDPRTTAADRDYLIRAVNAVFPEVHLTPDDIESSWAGLRPLIREENKGPSEISRKDEIIVSSSGLITIAGGKLTGFRKMAEKVTDLVSKQLQSEDGRAFRPCGTDRQGISGGDYSGYATYEDCKQSLLREGIKQGLGEQQAGYLISQYGTNSSKIFRYFTSLSSEAPDAENRALIAELAYCIEHEMTTSLADFLIRRTGRIYFQRAEAERILEPSLSIMARELQWSEPETMRQKQAMLKELAKVTQFPESND